RVQVADDVVRVGGWGNHVVLEFFGAHGSDLVLDHGGGGPGGFADGVAERGVGLVPVAVGAGCCPGFGGVPFEVDVGCGGLHLFDEGDGLNWGHAVPSFMARSSCSASASASANIAWVFCCR